MLDRPDTQACREAAPMLRSAALASAPSIRHGFFGRRGGVSDGIYASLNVGTGSADDASSVARNRATAGSSLGVEPNRLVTVHQVHSADVVMVEGPFEGERPRADALVTAKPGLAIAVLTADCGPVLFADGDAGIVGAAHAGWRGTVSGVLEATVAAMKRLGARRGSIQAVLGPTITQPNYEVGADMAETIVRNDPDAAAFFVAGAAADKRLFDLPGLILSRLARAGVAASFVGRCTYADAGAYYSFRRATHRAEPDYGRQLSGIALHRPTETPRA